jgi:hypothetical protein
MKKIVLVFCAIILAAAGCQRKTAPATPPAAPETSKIFPLTSTSTLTEIDANWNLYHNSQYSFEIRVPKKVNISAIPCPGNGHQELSPVNITEQDERVIIASAQVFTNPTCTQKVANIYPYPGTKGGVLTPYGWVMYVTSGINSVASFDSFVKQSLGPGCQGYSEGKNQFLIRAAGSTRQSLEQILDKCPFMANKYRLEYNPASGVVLFFNLGGSPQFFQANPTITPYDGDMIMSLKFD